jgi:phosphate starvation-inducible PhoH-like protein
MFCLISLSKSFKSIHISSKIRTNTISLNSKKTGSDNISNFYKPKSSNQEIYNNFLNDYKIKILVAYGPAGTGKTLLACNNAIKQLKSNSIDKIIITRPVVSVDEELGFLPGNINEKMGPWTRPIFDIFLDFFSQKEIDHMIENKVIEISPLAYMRGRTFKNAFIIADEMQNSSPNQMLMLLTRIGIESKIIITGDLQQSDKGTMSGLNDLINKYNLYKSQNNENDTSDIQFIELNNSDIKRNPIIEKLLNIYNTKELPQSPIVVKEEPQSPIVVKEEPIVENKQKNIFLQCNQNKYDTNDCALIPKHHISRHFKV